MNRTTVTSGKGLWDDIGQMLNITSLMWRLISHDDNDRFNTVHSRNVTVSSNVTINPIDFTPQLARNFQIAATVMMSIIVVFGVVGNALVIYIILGHQRFRTVTNLLLLNLSFADQLFLLVCGILAILHHVFGEWMLGDGACRLMQYLMYVTCYVTIYTITAVAVVRYVIVVKETTKVALLEKSTVVGIICAIWGVFALLNIPILFIYAVNRDPVSNKVECLIGRHKHGQELFATYFIFAYALPLSVIATLYVSIVRHIRKRDVNSSLLQSKRYIIERRERHIVRAAIVVVFVFAVCWLPLHVHLLVVYFSNLHTSRTSRLLLVLWHVLAYSNSILNPVIYNLFCQEFRKVTLALFKRKR